MADDRALARYAVEEWLKTAEAPSGLEYFEQARRRHEEPVRVPWTIVEDGMNWQLAREYDQLQPMFVETSVG